MNKYELKITGALAAIFSFRLLGMFMVLPVLATYTLNLPNTTPALIGIALGIYGITQAILQIPFGIWSDKIGRKPVIYIGLALFALGAIIAASTNNIWGIIIGRAIQGSGAISAAVMAQVSDLTREQNRTKAMAIIGASIGTSFAFALILGPVLAKLGGLNLIFWFTAFLSISGMVILALVIPNNPPIYNAETNINQHNLWQLLANLQLMRLNLGIFVLHALLMATFVIIPLTLVDTGLLKEQHWWVYLVALIAGFILMLPIMIYGEKMQHLRFSFIAAIMILLVCEIFMYFYHSNITYILIGLILFFTAFNLLEATLPSLISKIAPSGSKGSAMGIYATCQFLGTALGGIGAGFLLQHLDNNAVITACIAFAGVWLICAISMQEPPYLTTIKINLTTKQQEQSHLILNSVRNLNGVKNVVINEDKTILYVKFDSKLIQVANIEHVI